MIFNTSNWLAASKKFIPKMFNISGVDVPMIALTEDLEQQVKTCETADEMILMAADYGITSDGVRAIDDEETKLLLCDLWLLDEMQVEGDVSLKHQVGEKVCEISGMTGFVSEQKEFEELEAKELDEQIKINDDISVPGNTELDNLAQAALDQNAITNANV